MSIWKCLLGHRSLKTSFQHLHVRYATRQDTSKDFCEIEESQRSNAAEARLEMLVDNEHERNVKDC